MFETMHPAPPLATARDLAAYHANREHFYRMATVLLTTTPDRATLAGVRRAPPARGDAALLAAGGAAQSEFDRLFGGDAPAVDARCANVADPVRRAALERTALSGGRDVLAELRALAVLADRTASAIEGGDLAEAAAVSDAQAHFLRRHAAACIRRMATQLIAANLPFYAALGRALVIQIDDDLRLLADRADGSAT